MRPNINSILRHFGYSAIIVWHRHPATTWRSHDIFPPVVMKLNIIKPFTTIYRKNKVMYCPREGKKKPLDQSKTINSKIAP